MSAEHIKSVITEREPGLPVPHYDALGLASDPIYMSSRETSEGKEFVLVHSRPFSGAQMYIFLNSVAPHSNSRAFQREIYTRIVQPNPNRKRDRGEDFEDRLERLHRAVDGSGTGLAFSDFVNIVGDEWVDALNDPTFDSVFIPIAGMRPYRDFAVKAKSEVEKWKQKATDPKDWHSREEILRRLEELVPSDNVETIRQQYKHRTNDFYQLGNNLASFLDTLSNEEAEIIMGRSLSDYVLDGLYHKYAHRLILDLAKQRYWYDILTFYPIERGPRFAMPEMAFGNNSLSVVDAQNDISIEINFGEGNDDSLSLPWTISNHHFPQSSYVNGRYAAIAWKEDKTGKKAFFSDFDTRTAVYKSHIPILGTPDSYLGKLLIRYFRTRGEYVESHEEKKWLAEMGLPGSDSKRPITDRELPIWIQLPQHQSDLLGSKFIVEAQRLAT